MRPALATGRAVDDRGLRSDSVFTPKAVFAPVSDGLLSVISLLAWAGDLAILDPFGCGPSFTVARPQ